MSDSIDSIRRVQAVKAIRSTRKVESKGRKHPGEQDPDRQGSFDGFIQHRPLLQDVPEDPLKEKREARPRADVPQDLPEETNERELLDAIVSNPDGLLLSFQEKSCTFAPPGKWLDSKG